MRVCAVRERQTLEALVLGNGDNRFVSRSEIPVNHPVQRIHNFYDRVADLGFIPRDSFNPMEHPKELPWVQLIQRCSGGRFYFRVMGGRVGDLYGRNHTGRYLDEFVDKQTHGHIWTSFEEALDRKKPVLSRMRIPVKERDFLQVYQGSFPCKKDMTELLIVPIAPIASEY